MKYIKSYKLFEKVQSYNWNLSSYDKYKQEYNFSDGKNEYLVEFTKRLSKDDEVELKWFVIDNGSPNMNKLVNSNPFRITETILGDILKDYLNRNKWVNLLYMQGLGKETEREFETQRTRFYVRYLKNNPISNYTLYHGGNEIELVKNDE